VVATLASHVLEQTVVGPALIECAAVTDVTVLPAFRRRGIFDELMRRFLRDAHRRGDVLAVLAASTADLYGRYGFGVATWAQSGRLVLERALRRAEAGPPGTLVTLTVAEALEALPEVFEVVRGRRPGELSRPIALFDELFEDVPPREERTVTAVVIDGTVDAYAVYDRSAASREPRGRVRVVEVAATSEETRRQLWEHLCSCGASELVLDQLACDDVAAAARTSGGRPEVRTTDRTWNRLVDVLPALASRRYHGPDVLVLAVDDEVCGWNTGHYRLVVDALGYATVEPTDDDADLELSAGALATIYSGSSSAADLASTRTVIERSEGGLARADRMFSSTVTPFCTALC
jgi:predicted acetyltransferase